MTGNASIELSKSHDDWPGIRECFVQSFRRYPLYKYMVPDDNKREAFLRAYLDANYDVTVRSGQGILLAISGRKDADGEKTKLVGGVLFVPPSSDGCGWAIGSDEPYWKAYEKHGLADISKEGLERVKRYEAWENENVAKKIASSKLPMWNGLFCAIIPEFSSKGFGSLVYREAIRIMARHWKDIQRKLATANSSARRLLRAPERPEHELASHPTSGLKDLLSSKLLHGFSLLNHRQMPTGISLAAKGTDSSRFQTQSGTDAQQHIMSQTESGMDILRNPGAPLVAAISHSERSASFHASNGFHPVVRIPYFDSALGETPFYAHVLALDPFRTGRLGEFDALLTGGVNCSVNPKLAQTQLGTSCRSSHCDVTAAAQKIA